MSPVESDRNNRWPIELVTVYELEGPARCLATSREQIDHTLDDRWP